MSLCECGCGIEVRKRFAHGHHGRKIKFVHGVDWIEDAAGCWIWQWAKGPNGYGRYGDKANHRTLMSHRAVYERLVGRIPEGKQLDHLCRNPICCNPEHLEVVTNAENTRRSSKAKLTQAIVDEIRAAGLSHHQTARRFGISAGHAGRILRGERWAAL